ncbi:MAG: hypothetical protein AMXMBFR47_21030 [Planctomycetota bacterium]
MSNGRQLRPVNPRPASRLAAEAMPTPVEWLWPGRVPLGKLTLVVGDPGVGKSLLMADIAARLSRGLAFPDSPPPAARAPSATAAIPGASPTPDPQNRPHLGRIVIASSDDALDDTLVHRLTAAGADLSLITILEGVLGPDAARLRRGFTPGAFSDSRTPSAAPPQTPSPGVPPSATPAASSPAARSPAPGSLVAGSSPPLIVLDEPCPRPPDPDRQPYSLAEHFELLEETVRGIKWLRLVILDALPALLATRTDWQMRDFAEITRMLGDDAFTDRFGRQLLTMTPRQVRSVNSVAASLVRLAARRDAAIVGVTHLAKTRGQPLLARARCPLAFLAAARSILLVSPDPLVPGRRVLTSLKTTHNRAPSPGAFLIDPTGPRLLWVPPPAVSLDPTRLDGCPARASHANQPAGASFDAALARPIDPAAEPRSALADAANFLLAALAAGPRPSREILREAASAAINIAALRRAKYLLNITATRLPNEWTWSLPAA